MKAFFLGWYIKCQANGKTLSVIPAFHRNGKRSACSIQIITDEGAWNVTYPASLWKKRKGFGVDIGDNRFGTDGFTLSVEGDGISAHGSVRFGDFAPLKGDVMGPFRFLPFLECRHEIVSMEHALEGEISVNGTLFRFDHGRGYIEGDRGRSFPRRYAWTHCFLEGGSLFLSVADIPIGPFRFTGIVGSYMRNQREMRFATYRGAKVTKIGDGTVTVRQGKKTLTAALLERTEHPLFAPAGGEMARTIRESASCRARYRLSLGDERLFDTESPFASFEYEYPF